MLLFYTVLDNVVRYVVILVIQMAPFLTQSIAYQKRKFKDLSFMPIK